MGAEQRANYARSDIARTQLIEQLLAGGDLDALDRHRGQLQSKCAPGVVVLAIASLLAGRATIAADR
jgi:hypothetical protein